MSCDRVFGLRLRLEVQRPLTADSVTRTESCKFVGIRSRKAYVSGVEMARLCVVEVVGSR